MRSGMLTQSLLESAPFAMALIAAGAIAMAYKVRKTKAVAGISQTTAYIDPVGAAGVLGSATQENTGPAAGANLGKFGGTMSEANRGPGRSKLPRPQTWLRWGLSARKIESVKAIRAGASLGGADGCRNCPPRHPPCHQHLLPSYSLVRSCLDRFSLSRPSTVVPA